MDLDVTSLDKRPERQTPQGTVKDDPFLLRARFVEPIHGQGPDERNQQAEDSEHHQQFDERESARAPHRTTTQRPQPM
jgi:hypothetical protein